MSLNDKAISRIGEKALSTIPRVLGLCDRMEGSETIGCCDRPYWQYRTIDFPNARLQEAGLLFALANRLNVEGNRFHNSQAMADWARAVWRFWLDRRNGDGSVCEAYPFERSFCATAFTTAAFMETVILSGGSAQWAEELNMARSSVRWLMKNRNQEVANQMAASALALRGYALLTGEKEWDTAATNRRDETLSLMDDDGGFCEYGGLDVGYQSISMSAIARLMIISGGDDAIEAALGKAEKRISPLIGEDGRTDPEKNSRMTQYLYPYSFAVLKSDILDRVREGLSKDRILNPTWMDDRYCIPFAIDYLFAEASFHDANDNI